MKPALLALILCTVVASGFDKSAFSEYIPGAVIAIAVLGYLVYCLLKAEKL